MLWVEVSIPTSALPSRVPWLLVCVRECVRSSSLLYHLLPSPLSPTHSLLSPLVKFKCMVDVFITMDLFLLLVLERCLNRALGKLVSAL